MAKIYADGAGEIIAIRVNEAEEAIYGTPQAAEVLEFDEETNPTILPAIAQDHNGHRCQGGVLSRNGTPYVLAANGDRRDLIQTRASLITNLQAYRDAASPTQAQTVAVVKLLCRVVIYFLRTLR